MDPVIRKTESDGSADWIDRSAFAVYCQSYARWKEAQEHINSEGATYETENGMQRPNLWVAICNTEQRLMMQAAAVALYLLYADNEPVIMLHVKNLTTTIGSLHLPAASLQNFCTKSIYRWIELLNWNTDSSILWSAEKSVTNTLCCFLCQK